MENKEFYKNYMECFLSENSKVNLISKNDEKYLWEKHIYDSLAISLFFDKYKPESSTLLDIGTGGGFPSVPIAITYPEIKVTAVDSIAKKIRSIENMKSSLDIKNLEPVCARVEALTGRYDIVTSRAVASLRAICAYALQKLNKNGYFIAYKSKKYKEEIDEASNILKKYRAEIIDVIEYDLPLEEKPVRNLVVIKFKQTL